MIVFHLGFPKTGTTSLQFEWKRFLSKDYYNPESFDKLWKDLYYREFFTNTFNNSGKYRRRVNEIFDRDQNYLLSYESALGFNPYWSEKRLQFLRDVFLEHDVLWLITLPRDLTLHVSRVYRHKLSEGFVVDWMTFQALEDNAHSGFSVNSMKGLINTISDLGSAGVILIKPNELLKSLPRLNVSNASWLSYVVNYQLVRQLNKWLYGKRVFGVLIMIIKYLKRNHKSDGYSSEYETTELGPSWIDNFDDDILTSIDKGHLSNKKVLSAKELLEEIENSYVWNFSRV